MTAYTLIEDTPNKQAKTSLAAPKSNSDNDSCSDKSEQDSSDNDDYDTSYEHQDPSNGFVFKNVDNFKRKANLSPISEPLVQSKKDRKRLRKLIK